VEEWLTVEETPGLLVLQGPSPVLGGRDHFHCFGLTHAVFKATVEKKLPETVWGLLFEEALQSTWLLLGFMGQDTRDVLLKFSREVPFLRAVAKRWHALDGMGARYTLGSQSSERLWELPTNIQYLLGRLSGTLEIVRRPLPPEGLAGLITLLLTRTF
jgi:hypothetical protein